MGRKRRRVLIVLAVPVVALATASLWGHRLCATPPGAASPIDARSAEGSLLAGAGHATFQLPWPLPLAGYRPFREEVGAAALPLEASAIVLEVSALRVAIVTVDLMIAPASVVDEVRARARRLGLAEVWVSATHPHSSVGGYDARLLSEVGGVGRYRRAVQTAVADAVEQALQKALAQRAPATLTLGSTEAPGLTGARDGIEPAERRLTRLEVRTGDGRTAQLVILGGHPTLVERDVHAADPDYPGRLAQLERPAHEVTLVLQGGAGNAAALPPPGPGSPPDRQAAAWHAVLGRLESAPLDGTRLAFARVRVPLPCPDASRLVPAFVALPGRPLLCTWTPESVEVSLLSVGTLHLLFLPGEPTFAAAQQLEAAAGAERAVSLTNGYLGYVELPDRVRAGQGEAVRQYYGPELLARLEQGAAEAARLLAATVSPAGSSGSPRAP